ncbi:MAG: glycosyltransferase [Clostridia bacterium]|jgi:glycosyltransferase
MEIKMNKNDEPLISVIVPVYNGENYIDDCIMSVLNQEYKNFELILVNDGSQDGSKEKLNIWEKKNEKIKVIHQSNSGVSVARNTGIEKANGKYLTFIDVDDYISKDFLFYYYNLIKKYDAEIALTPMPQKFSNHAECTTEKIEDNIKVLSGEKAACEMLYYNIAIGPWNKLISKELIDKYKIRFNPNLAYGEGFNFSVDCFQRAKKVAVGRKKVYYYRVNNPNSAMTKFKLKLVTGSIEAQKCIKNNLVNKTTELLKACRYANWHTYCDCLNTIIGCKVIKQNKELYNDIKKVCKKDAKYAIKSPIPKSDKMKGILYGISPYLTAKLINKFRKRKFTI